MQNDEDLTSKRITSAMHALPRDRFIEMSDSSLVLGRSIPPSNAVSEVLHHAGIHPDHKVLQIGTGAGYLSAVLSKLAANVVTMEANPAIARIAQAARMGARALTTWHPSIEYWYPAPG